MSLSLVMFILKILTDLSLVKQKIRVKNIFCRNCL